MQPDRSWMYSRRVNGFLQESFLKGVDEFIDFATRHPTFMNGAEIKCPCNARTCKNQQFTNTEIVRLHLVKNGFVPEYEVWTFHGQKTSSSDEGDSSVSREATFENPYIDMVVDEARRNIPNFNPNSQDSMADEEQPNPAAKLFYEMLEAANVPLWDGCKKHTKLSLVARLMTLKAENRLSEKCYDQLIELMEEIVPENNEVPRNFYDSKKLLRGMGLPAEKIDCCEKGCMIYWGADVDLINCKVCGFPRYKKKRKRQKTNVPYKTMYYFPLTPRLQRLYSSNATAEHMRWHASHESEEGVMNHPSDSEAWKNFSKVHPTFAAECRNVRLGLSVDGFQPFGKFGKQYSSWPVVLTPYNLPPGMCMKEQYMFLTVLVPGPHNPKDRLDIYLQPLIAELKKLWEVGVPTYDVSVKFFFQLRAALMWTISDFPAYAMLSGWSTAGALACPHCMEESDAFTLRCSGKQSWFDNHRKFLPHDHPFRRNKVNFKKNLTVMRKKPVVRTGADILREIEEEGLMRVIDEDAFSVNKEISKTCGWKKRSIFWDLPYWSSNMIRHNLDVMHIEKNVFENIFNTIMNIQKKTKDTAKSREELNDYCRRPELKRDSVTGKYPRACYTLEDDAKIALCQWVQNLNFPDQFASNLGRCVDLPKKKLIGMKSHDCHVFMQRLIPIAFRELLPPTVWSAITELSIFFKELTSTVISVTDMERLENDIPVILCKLERIFPPSFFDSMEHLPIHLPYEAKIAGPVQYRWMYPFERYLRKLKDNVGNKSRIEGSIANADLMEEAASFCSYYFEDHVRTKSRNMPRNHETESDDDDQDDVISIFKKSGRPKGKKRRRYLNEAEYTAARDYVLLNCAEVVPYTLIYSEQVRQVDPTISDDELNKRMEAEFHAWFKQYVADPVNHVTNNCLKSLSLGPFRIVTTCHVYIGNGYRFHTISRATNRATVNSGICIKAANYDENEHDFYGRLTEVVVLEYPGYPQKTTVLFNCEWFDPSARGMKIHPQYNLVDINHKRRLNKFEPFVLATQAEQVCYSSYPSLKRDKIDWWAVFKVKPRCIVPLIESFIPPSFQEENIETRDPIQVEDAEGSLEDPSGDAIEMPYELSETEDEFEFETEDEIENLDDSDDDSDDGSG